MHNSFCAVVKTHKEGNIMKYEMLGLGLGLVVGWLVINSSLEDNVRYTGTMYVLPSPTKKINGDFIILAGSSLTDNAEIMAGKKDFKTGCFNAIVWGKRKNWYDTSSPGIYPKIIWQQDINCPPIN
jgi:hypothetical protein